MVFTDYLSSLSVDAFNEKNNGTDIRVFAFVVGTTNEVKEIEEFTCKNRGEEMFYLLDVFLSLSSYTDSVATASSLDVVSLVVVHM